MNGMDSIVELLRFLMLFELDSVRNLFDEVGVVLDLLVLVLRIVVILEYKVLDEGVVSLWVVV